MALGRTTEPVDDDEKSGLDLRPNGDAMVWVAGKRLRLRIRRFRDYATLVDAQREAMDDLRELSDEALAWSADLQNDLADGDGRPPTPDERAEDVKRGRQIEDRTNELAVEWWSLAMATLLESSDGEWDPDADLRPWMANFVTVAQVLEHWRSAPSLSGGR